MHIPSVSCTTCLNTHLGVRTHAHTHTHARASQRAGKILLALVDEGRWEAVISSVRLMINCQWAGRSLHHLQCLTTRREFDLKILFF